MKKLRARLYSMHLEEETAKRYNARKIQVRMSFRNTYKVKIFMGSVVFTLVLFLFVL